jgi:hypothetical protein
VEDEGEGQQEMATTVAVKKFYEHNPTLSVVLV